MLNRLNLQIACLIFLLALTVFGCSKVRQCSDARYSTLVSENLMYRGKLSLDRFDIPWYKPKKQVGYISNGEIYQLELVGKHRYYLFPIGSPILSIPYVYVLNRFGQAAINPDGTVDLQADAFISSSLAVLLMALLASLVFLTSRLLLPVSWSCLITLGSTLGTQVWSTASRALWADTWGILLLALVVWMLVAGETNSFRIRPVWLATLLAFLYFIRPTYAIPIAAITVYVSIYHRKLLIPYVLTGAAWGSLFVGYSLFHYGHILPTYYLATRLSFANLSTALLGNLISPSRGLLIFVPVLLFIGYLLARYAQAIRFPKLAVLSLIVITLHLLSISGFGHWWGGHSYGPRYTTGLVPWFVLLSILAVQAWQSSQLVARDSRFTAERILGSVLLLISITINGIGANSHQAWLWNVSPTNVDLHPDRLWDWHHPQFLCGITYHPVITIPQPELPVQQPVRTEVYSH